MVLKSNISFAAGTILPGNLPTDLQTAVKQIRTALVTSRIAEKNGQAVIFKNNRPKYMLIDIENSPIIDMTNDEIVEVGLSVADGSMDYEALRNWAARHRVCPTF